MIDQSSMKSNEEFVSIAFKRFVHVTYGFRLIY